MRTRLLSAEQFGLGPEDLFDGPLEQRLSRVDGKRLEVKIPPGVRTGSRIRVRHERKSHHSTSPPCNRYSAALRSASMPFRNQNQSRRFEALRELGLRHLQREQRHRHVDDQEQPLVAPQEGQAAACLREMSRSFSQSTDFAFSKA